MSSTISESESDAGPVITADISPSTFTSDSNIEVTARPATVKWRASDGQDQCLSNLNFDLHYDVQSSKAFLKFRAAVAFKSQHRSRNTAVFLFLYPERIRALALDDSPCTAEAKALGPETVCLHFELNRVSALVMPKESVVPRNQASSDLLDSLRALVQQAAFSVYVKVPCRRLPRQRLLALCGAISRHELKSIDAHSNTSSLYGGAGGQVIEGDSLLGADSTVVDDGHVSIMQPPVENLPSYSEVPPGPPPAVGSVSHKRRRLSTDDAEAAPRERLDRKFIEDICAHMINSRLGEIRQDMAKQLEDLENRMINYVDEQLILQRQEIIEDVGIRAEDEYYGLKLDLQNYIHEEIEEVQGQILDRISTASFSLQLNP